MAKPDSEPRESQSEFPEAQVVLPENQLTPDTLINNPKSEKKAGLKVKPLKEKILGKTRKEKPQW